MSPSPCVSWTFVFTSCFFFAFTRPYRALRPTLHGAPQECIPASFLSHRQSGRRSVSPMSCGWCSCHSSSAGHGSASRSSSWACFSSCPTSEQPKTMQKISVSRCVIPNDFKWKPQSFVFWNMVSSKNVIIYIKKNKQFFCLWSCCNEILLMQNQTPVQKKDWWSPTRHATFSQRQKTSCSSG